MFTGQNSKGLTNTIEKIPAVALHPNSTVQWLLIELTNNILSPQTNTVVAPLNETEIVIMGGRDISGYLGDVIVFNTQTQKFQNVVQDSTFKFTAVSNQCA